MKVISYYLTVPNASSLTIRETPMRLMRATLLSGVTATVLSVELLAGCASIGKKFQADTIATQMVAARPLGALDSASWRPPHLLGIIDPEAKETLEPEKSQEAIDRNTRRLTQAYAKVYASAKDVKLERSRIQDRLITDSTTSCTQYLALSTQWRTNAGFSLGVVSTLAGVAGAAMPIGAAARALSAVAGGASGTRAEFEKDYYQDRAMDVLTKGIRAERAAILQQIDDNRTKEARDYTIEKAVNDALRYHDACGMLAGLIRASEAIDATRGTDVGLQNALATLGLVQVASGAVTAVQDADGLDRLLKEITDDWLNTEDSDLTNLQPKVTALQDATQRSRAQTALADAKTALKDLRQTRAEINAKAASQISTLKKSVAEYNSATTAEERLRAGGAMQNAHADVVGQLSKLKAARDSFQGKKAILAQATRT
jgi:hypothetical protein